MHRANLSILALAMSSFAFAIPNDAVAQFQPSPYQAASRQHRDAAVALVVHQPAELLNAGHAGQSPRETLRSGTVVVGLQRLSGSGGSAPLWQVVTTGQSPRQGFVTASAVTPLATVRQEVQARSIALRHPNRADPERLPDLIQLQQNPAVRQAWSEVVESIRDNESLPENQRLPEPYFARAEIWASVHNNSAALQDYLTAIAHARTAGRDLVTYSAYFDKLHEMAGKLQREPVPATQGGQADYDMAARLHYGEGYSEFFQGNVSAAQERFDSAVQLAPDRALYWYWRALCHKRLGDDQRAQHDALMGAYFEQQMEPYGRRALHGSFSRVQGGTRMWLESFRRGDPAHRIVQAVGKTQNQTGTVRYP